MKKALALVIGNSDYQMEKFKLTNAANDAVDFAKKLQTLDFNVIEVINCTEEIADKALADFGEELKNYTTGLFYFSGHGLQISGANYLTTIDTGFQDEYTAKRTSLLLEKVIGTMEAAGPEVKILILDACRNDPFSGKYRGINNEGLAPVFAPKGSIIAFSTSPGETAQDFGAGRNSIYTGALLNHINDPDVPIEDFFKRVRTTVYSLSVKKQTPWEHTSLIGNFYFNSGQMVQSLTLPYKPDHVADGNFHSSGSDIDQIIMSLRSHNWYKQNSALDSLENRRTRDFDNSSLFLLGRNILQAAIGRSGQALKIIEGLDNWLQHYFKDNSFHVLNGILFEIYFGPDGKFRKKIFKDGAINQVFALQSNKLHASSFDFIARQLYPHKDELLYFPANPPISLAVEVVLEKNKPDEFIKADYILKMVKLHDADLMAPFTPSPMMGYPTHWPGLKNMIADRLTMPTTQLRISANMEPEETSIMLIPEGFTLSKNWQAKQKEKSAFPFY